MLVKRGLKAPGGHILRWCDLTCPDAEFPRDEAVDGAGSCRTFAAIYCRKLGRLTPKNAPCQAEEPARKEDRRAGEG